MSLAAPSRTRTGRVADAPSPRSAKRRNAIVLFLILVAVAFVMLTPCCWCSR